jgi:hypothetical protein
MPRRPTERTLPPLLEEAMRRRESPFGRWLTRSMFGLEVVIVPLRLMPYRGAARMMIGELLGYGPDELHDVRVRTVAGEPSWIIANGRPAVARILAETGLRS